MKKTLLTLLAASSILTAGSFAQLGAGFSKGDNSDNFVTFFAGLNMISNIQARLEYTKNTTENDLFSREDISRYGVFATYTLPILPSFSLTPKIGLFKTDGSFTIKETLEKVTDSSTNFTYGLEANYDMNEKVSLFVGYTDYGNNLDIKHFDTSKLDNKNYTFGIKINL